MAMDAGLSAGIINPNAALMRQAYDTYCVLGGFDSQCRDYIEKYAAMQIKVVSVGQVVQVQVVQQVLPQRQQKASSA